MRGMSGITAVVVLAMSTGVVGCGSPPSDDEIAGVVKRVGGAYEGMAQAARPFDRPIARFLKGGIDSSAWLVESFGGGEMPKLLRARPAKDADEEAKTRRLASSRHAPGDWILRARMISLSWDGLRTAVIARMLHCHPQTVRERFTRFNAEGLDGLGDRPGPGRKPRLTESECSAIIALVGTPPPGALVQEDDSLMVRKDAGKGNALWSLDALAEAAKARGIQAERSQVRRIQMKEGVRWRQVRSWARSAAPEFAPKGRQSSRSTPRLR